MKITGQETIADLFGVAPKTIVEWQSDGFPVEVRGSPGVPSRYDSALCVRWLVDREVRKVTGPETARERLYRIQGDKAELEYREARGQLIRAADIEPKIKGAVIAAREFLRSQPPRLVALLEHKDNAARESLLRQIFDEFLTRLSDWRGGGIRHEEVETQPVEPTTPTDEPKEM